MKKLFNDIDGAHGIVVLAASSSGTTFYPASSRMASFGIPDITHEAHGERHRHLSSGKNAPTAFEPA
jgi:hypothetical protein